MIEKGKADHEKQVSIHEAGQQVASPSPRLAQDWAAPFSLVGARV